MDKITLSIEGMTCSACSNAIDKYLKKQKGIEDSLTNLVLACTTITYNKDIISIYNKTIIILIYMHKDIILYVYKEDFIMQVKNQKVPLGIQIDADLNDRLNECARAEKRTKRAVVELALEEHFERSEALKKLHTEVK